MKKTTAGISRATPESRNEMPWVVLALAVVLRRKRRRLGLSLNRLAALSHVSHPMLGWLENQKYFPSAETLTRVAPAVQRV